MAGGGKEVGKEGRDGDKATIHDDLGLTYLRISQCVCIK